MKVPTVPLRLTKLGSVKCCAGGLPVEGHHRRALRPAYQCRGLGVPAAVSWPAARHAAPVPSALRRRAVRRGTPGVACGEARDAWYGVCSSAYPALFQTAVLELSENSTCLCSVSGQKNASKTHFR